MVDARARAKHLEQGHIADHMLERVSSHYAALRLLQHQTAQSNNLGSNTSTEDEQKRMAPGEEEKALAAASPSAKAAESIIAPAVGGSAGGLGDGLGGGISASKFIALPGNAGPKSTLISLPIERSSDDSDEDETGGSASSMDHEVVSKRNLSMMNKHLSLIHI